MFRIRVLAPLAFAAALLAANAPRARADSTLYALTTPPSSLQIGCQGPCECPVVTTPTYGSFQLVKTGNDPLYTYYDVVGYIASYNNGPGAVSITGSGHYKIGGEFALVDQMTLDLDIEGRPTQHFDSGLHPVRAAFPGIDVACAAHDFACYDTVLVVSAKPISTTDAPPAVAVGLQAAWPNPFAQGLRITYALDRAGPVELRIVDLAGRHVRTLAASASATTGPQTVTWDGLRDDGRRAPAGVYWVLLRWADGVDRRRVVKLG
jgi:hypothetical protein